ncbi:MAG: tetratricopeptide repeat protein [Myxococcota bacterium]|nr:tetratricopeptide repeat protein [Myxococcota bacterium]
MSAFDDWFSVPWSQVGAIGPPLPADRFVCRGTGFVAGDGRHVLTCWHVVEAAGRDGRVAFAPGWDATTPLPDVIEGRVQEALSAPEYDLALVELDRCLEGEGAALHLGDLPVSPRKEYPFRSCGYRVVDSVTGAVTPLAGAGRVRCKLTTRAWLPLRTSDQHPGMSGAPIVVGSPPRVIAVGYAEPRLFAERKPTPGSPAAQATDLMAELEQIKKAVADNVTDLGVAVPVRHLPQKTLVLLGGLRSYFGHEDEPDEHSRGRGLLETGIEEPRPAALPSHLLRAGAQAVGFRGRGDELADLEVWWALKEPVGVRVFTGLGGAGKTRLLVEWCRRLRGRGAVAGFLGGERTAADIDPLFAGAGARLVVVDYASSRPDVLRELLKRMAEPRSPQPWIRVVFLERGSEKAEWWEQLSASSNDLSRFVEHHGQPIELRDLLPAPAERAAHFQAAVQEFAALRKIPPPGVAAPDLSGEDFGRPLSVQMAALVAVLGDEPLDRDPRANPVERLLDKVLEHERRQWTGGIREAAGGQQLLERLALETFEGAVALCTLRGGAGDEPAAKDLLRRSLGTGSGLGDLQTQALLRALAGLLHRFYGGGAAPWVRPLEPDLLGEQLVDRALLRDPGLVDWAFDGADSETKARALTVLTRLAGRREKAGDTEARRWLVAALKGRLEELADVAVEVAARAGDPLGMVLADVMWTAGSVALAEKLMDILDERYQQTVALRELAVVTTRKVLDARRGEWASPIDEQRAELARLANNLGMRLGELGRREEALAATQEAVEIRRELSRARPDAFLPDLAGSLNNLGNRLSELGRREEALAATQEAVETLAPLFRRLPAAFAGRMSTMLANYVRKAEQAGREPDARLVGSIGGILKDLARQEPGGSGGAPGGTNRR